MSSPLFNLLADLAKDSEKLQALASDPDSLLSQYELTDEQKELIKQGGEENFIRLLVEERARRFQGGEELVACI
ncbi:MAG TPA: hypothetical protein DCY91_04320 [Cyanobacteria bacterium UBA11370]|nr:hypothetical protein [Cyanobacteria bacterium UBA11370]HBY78288.1 hypothetical protein [Cyanobacteria bacterium UBA11148]